MGNKTGRCDGTCDDCECPPAKDIPPEMAEQFRRAVAGPQPANHQSCEVAQVGNSTTHRESEWQPISTLPLADDLIWLRIGDSIEGPRAMDPYDYDKFNEWAPCEPPSDITSPARLTNQNPLTDHQPVDETGNLQDQE